MNGLSIGLGVALLAGGIAAQGYEVEMFPYQLMQQGSWSVPHMLPLAEDYKGEIAHLALLPPPIDKSVTPWVTLPGSPRVFLACQRGDGPQSYGLTHLWKPLRPSAAVPIPVPIGYPTDDSQDFFCGGHTFLFDGRFLWVNGTNPIPASPCVLSTGHDGAWVLDSHEADPLWIPAAGLAMNKPLIRWYSTATAMGDQTVIVHGHTGCPMPGPEPDLGNSAYRDRFTWTSSSKTFVWGESSPGDSPANTRFAAGCSVPLISWLSSTIPGCTWPARARSSGRPLWARFPTRPPGASS